MYAITSYKDLITEIEIAKTRIEGLRNQRESLVKLAFKSAPGELTSITYDGMPKGSRNDMSLDRIWEGIEKVDNQLIIEESLLYDMENTEQKIKDKLQSFEGLEYKIKYKKEIEGKTLKQIAQELNYSEDYIKHIHSKLK